jgi:hypothetical protein
VDATERDIIIVPSAHCYEVIDKLACFQSRDTKLPEVPQQATDDHYYTASLSFIRLTEYAIVHRQPALCCNFLNQKVFLNTSRWHVACLLSAIAFSCGDDR